MYGANRYRVGRVVTKHGANRYYVMGRIKSGANRYFTRKLYFQKCKWAAQFTNQSKAD